MQGFNKVILAGNVTRDPELRYTPSGSAIAQFGLALNRRWKDCDGEQKEETVFVDVTAFAKTAEFVAEHFRKGQYMLLEGRLKLDQWEDRQTGQRRQKLCVIAETVTILPDGQPEERPEPSPAPRVQCAQASNHPSRSQLHSKELNRDG